MTLTGKSKSDTRNLESKQEAHNHVPSEAQGQMPPPTAFRKRVAPPVTESMDIEDDFFSPGTQAKTISLLDLRPRKRNKEDR